MQSGVPCVLGIAQPQKKNVNKIVVLCLIFNFSITHFLYVEKFRHKQ